MNLTFLGWGYFLTNFLSFCNSLFRSWQFLNGLPLFFFIFFSFKKLSVFWVLYIFRVLIFCQMYSRHILCLRTWTALFQVLLNCKVSIKRLTIILLDFPFYLTYAIFQYTFICLYNFFKLCITWESCFFGLFILSPVWSLYGYDCPFSWFEKIFFYDFIEDLSALCYWVSILLSLPIIWISVFSS